ncbi:MAG: hypothetical protein F6J93_03585 [Oscillatoria sp. SIO1A7]|nr:hypothetical protein [Oscillatoria sp. SIO1A7]
MIIARKTEIEPLVLENILAVELHPVSFKKAWGLTNEKAAEYLHLSEQAVVAYGLKPTSSKYRNPSPAVKGLAAATSFILLSDGRKPVKPELLKDLLEFLN